MQIDPRDSFDLTYCTNIHPGEDWFSVEAVLRDAGPALKARLSPDKIRIDFRKYNWIGSISQDLTVCYVWHGLGVKTLAELKARPKVHYGSPAPAAPAISTSAS